MKQAASRILLLLSTMFVAALAAVMLQSPVYASVHSEPGHGRYEAFGSSTPTFVPRPSSYAFGPPPPIYVKPQNARGAYTRNRVWHSSQWWANNDPSWVKQHHPTWLGMSRPQPGSQAHG